MAYELKKKETIPEGMRRIASERIDKAINLLSGSSRKMIGDDAVHEARKRFKQLRGAIRLVQKELGRKQFNRENRALRDAGRPLSKVRDARVMVDTLDELGETYKDQLAASAFKHLRAALQKRRREIRQRVLSDTQASRSIAREMKKSARRVSDWPLGHTGWKAISGGLQKTYRKGRDAMEEVMRNCTDETLHEWRKRTKDLRYAVELLACEWPDQMKVTADSAHHLTDLLGQDHDLAVLRCIVNDEFKDAGNGKESELLDPLISQRRSELQKEAMELGRKLYAEPADDFVARIREYWRAWRKT